MICSSKINFLNIDLKAGGDVEGYRDNVANVLRGMTDETIVIPGHGDLANKSDLARFKHTLDASINWMRDQKQSGIALEDLKKQDLPEKWIETLHKGL
ncbi:hypothetical protein [Shewanella kaireitica]|uniref:hypothetical protein n=1 Tax=Shewanella kaireitica TaxID=212021 RepID=UPI00200C5635|nr:hypothetical protein [Shewanella kaireitica]MCL1095077.1 hypothetical protein [Shewanella kaireitica]